MSRYMKLFQEAHYVIMNKQLIEKYISIHFHSIRNAPRSYTIKMSFFPVNVHTLLPSRNFFFQLLKLFRLNLENIGEKELRQWFTS